MKSELLPQGELRQPWAGNHEPGAAGRWPAVGVESLLPCSRSSSPAPAEPGAKSGWLAGHASGSRYWKHLEGVGGWDPGSSTSGKRVVTVMVTRPVCQVCVPELVSAWPSLHGARYAEMCRDTTAEATMHLWKANVGISLLY